MARTIAEIEAQIIEQKNLNANLSGLTSTSNTALWRLWIYIVSAAIWMHEQVFEMHLKEVAEAVKSVTPYTLDWWEAKVLAFQYGDVLVDSDEYAVIDETKKIIKQAAVVEGQNKVTIKIATEDPNTNELVKIVDTAKVDAFKQYVFKIKVAGQPVTFVNENADRLKVGIDVYYDALIMTNEGVLINLDDDVNQIDLAIQNYLKSLEFNGALSITKLRDFIKGVQGVNDVDDLVAQYSIGLTPFNTVDRVYYPFSGYMNLVELNINFYAGN